MGVAWHLMHILQYGEPEMGCAIPFSGAGKSTVLVVADCVQLQWGGAPCQDMPCQHSCHLCFGLYHCCVVEYITSMWDVFVMSSCKLPCICLANCPVTPAAYAGAQGRVGMNIFCWQQFYYQLSGETIKNQDMIWGSRSIYFRSSASCSCALSGDQTLVNYPFKFNLGFSHRGIISVIRDRRVIRRDGG